MIVYMRYIINLLPRPQLREIIINYNFSRNAPQAFIEKSKEFSMFFFMLMRSRRLHC